MNETLVELLEHNLDHAAAFEGKFEHLQTGQTPEFVSVCCSDSRVLQDYIWGDIAPGTAFTCGTIGNRVIQQAEDGPVVCGDVLYPLVHTDTRMAVVVGHTGCGAITAVYDFLTDESDSSTEPPGIQSCIELLAPHLEPALELLPDDLDRQAAINHLVEYNVDRQIDFLADSEDVPEDVTVLGVVYDFQDVYSGKRGKVHVINVDGTRDPDVLREEHPEIEDRVQRLFTY